jgi:hypothetical protein
MILWLQKDTSECQHWNKSFGCGGIAAAAVAVVVNKELN